MSSVSKIPTESALLLLRNSAGYVSVKQYASVKNAKLAIQHHRSVEHEIIPGKVVWDFSDSKILPIYPERSLLVVCDSLKGEEFQVVRASYTERGWIYDLDRGDGEPILGVPQEEILRIFVLKG